MLIIGTIVFALLLIGAGLKTVKPIEFRKQTVETLLRFYPGLVRELLGRRRLSFWYKTARSPHKQIIWAYADRHSISPGEDFRLMMSAGPGTERTSGYLEVFRIGFYGNTDRKRSWRSDLLLVREYDINSTAAAIGPGWPAAVTIRNTADWETGYHSVDFVEPDGTRHEDIAFIVVTATNRKVDILVKLATSTYQAYNRWGGHNFYLYETPSTLNGEGFGVFETDIPGNRGDMVSFDRPTVSEFWEWEYYYVQWLEHLAAEEGLSVGYVTNFDFARDPRFAADCRLLISVGHDEYWSKEEFDHTYDRIFHQGGNTLFLGSNTAYWQVRYADVNATHGNEGRQMVCFKSMQDPICYRIDTCPELHVTARFRDDARRPETMLQGVACQSNLPFRRHEWPRYAYRVVSADLPFFEGTDYKPGDFVGDIIGHEWDCRDPETEFGCPGEARVEATERLWRAGRSHIDFIPASQIRTLFAGDVTDLAGRRGRAESVYFESPAGARVFSSGTNRWSWGLGKKGYTQERFIRFNRNLVLEFLRT